MLLTSIIGFIQVMVSHGDIANTNVLTCETHMRPPLEGIVALPLEVY